MNSPLPCPTGGSVSEVARWAARRILDTPEALLSIVEADPLPPRDALERIAEAWNPLVVEFNCRHVYSFIERNWTPANAAPVVQRVNHYAERVKAFFAAVRECLEHPEALDPRRDVCRRNLATFMVFANLLAEQLGEWADDIEVRQKRDAAAASASPTKVKRERGRPKGSGDSDSEFDKRCWNAWHTGKHRKYADCARELGEDAEAFAHAIDRHRKHRKKACQICD